MGNYMEYPSSWDKTNKYALKIYNKCKVFYGPDDEEKFMKVFESSTFYNVFCFIALGYTVLSLAIIIIKKDVYKKTKNSLVLACYSNASLYNKQNNQETNDNEKQNKFVNVSGVTKRVTSYFTESKIVTALMIYMCISLFYDVVISIFEINYTMNPVSKGFCTSQYEQAPQFILIGFFLFVFAPVAYLNINKLRSNFSYGKMLNISMILIIICSMLYIMTTGIPSYICSPISRYIPSDL
ncbi:hypothetical protein PIROE2DRAFT_3665 [Piromyces sp. E2]|nr:hypothetical protein PIROE2DRAFT_3665 [Piromyces sp. E2]|eukprot:OUM68534.1 hypothetical protein PIROE2DRAFT_3665 [Piromyces sp. E2]